MRLIDPELIDAKCLMPLTKLVDAVEQLPFEQQEAIADELCAAQEAVYPPIARRIRASAGASEGGWGLPHSTHPRRLIDWRAHGPRPASGDRQHLHGA